MNNNKPPDFEAIQVEIKYNYLDLVKGIMDVYEFIAYISLKYFKPVDPEYDQREDNNPYADLIFAMLEVNGIELY